MPHFVVHVEKARKIVISSRIMKVDIKSKTFNDIFEQLTTGKFYLRQFVTQAEEELPIDNTSTLAAAAHFNAFNRIMQSSAQQPSLPSLKTKDNQNNLLFNDIIRLLQQRKVKWNSNLYETAGKKFIERLAALIWYINPHLDKFCARSLHLPVLFQELSLYKQNTTYNQFYHHGKHKKEKLSHAKLEELVQSLSISVTQPWACSKVWEPIIQEYHAYGKFLRSKEDYEYVNLESFLPDDYSLIKQVTPAVLCTLYYDLTSDAAVTNDVIRSTFDAFWDEMAGFFNEKILAVDDHHHHDILYMPLAMSVQHLHDIIIKRLQNKFSTPLPNEIQIPCEEWIGLQFSPTNPIAASAIHYTGRFNVKFQIQTRLLRKEHPDSHYCACLFHYLREFAILFRNYVCLICADDKHKVPIGEGVATSTGVRNKKSMVLKEANLVACDYDFTKLSLTPSVIFICKVPLSIEESFYDGQVFVSYKDTIFQPSTVIRHTTEFFNVISAYYPQTIPPILCIYTDGGPDHRVTYGSVQISLICLFLCEDFDMLIALRTALHQSWTNPAERIMSILNLALQGVALM
ncbi:hypothetical protein GLOIN_2v1767477 [Rhizophagus irregularis DAOM 181602=DAOM 197198]|nr:hypothetical protein GLOIN_2v1767477 [Rhizophagus irregularis DAOM 181602=DAOM 197198]